MESARAVKLPPELLSDERIIAARLRAKPYKMSDGGGMHLLIMPSGSKYWRIRYRHEGKQKQLSLGVYPKISLEDARRRRAEVRASVADGIDPSGQRKAERAAQASELVRERVLPPFALDSDGGLSFRVGGRHLALSPTETGKLRAFLDATRGVAPKATPCH